MTQRDLRKSQLEFDVALQGNPIVNQPISVLLFDKDGNQLNNLVRWNASARTDDHGEYQFTEDRKSVV